MTGRTLRGLLFCSGLIMALSEASHAQIFERTDPQREIELGRQVGLELERMIGVSRDRAMQERVRRIGRTLVSAMPQRAYPYEFKVLQSRDFNAVSLPGGFMYVFEGLLLRLPDDDAVAFVMGHEITHASERHYREMVERMRIPSIAAVLAGAATGSWDLAQFALVMLSSEYSRDHEREADRGGIYLMHDAGFDPQGAVRAAVAIEEMEKGATVPVYLRSHPPAKERVRTLRSMAELLSQRSPKVSQRTGPRPVGETLGRDVRLPDAPGASPWLPLAVGNRWEYGVLRGDGGGEAVPAYSVEVRGRAEVGGGTVWRVHTSLSEGDEVAHYWLVSDRGVWRRNVRAPSTAGWRLEYALDSHDGWEVVGTETVSTPAGKFENALRLRRVGAGPSSEVWLVRGIGMVKRTSENGRVSEVLRAYRITPAADDGLATAWR